ncbi:MAG: fatty acid hydroxylase [Bacteroidetes bacterium]|nr:fatty acid hydroxylase [Bacteroidota bacterium]
MATRKIQNKGESTLFSNRFLESLTRSHPAYIYGMYLPVIGFMLYYYVYKLGNPGSQGALIFFAGILFWSFFEYLAHRYFFHLTLDHPIVHRIIYLVHGIHHEYPRDKNRIVLPPIPSLLLASSVFGLMYLLIGQGTLAFFPGFILGYLLYMALHYAIHTMAPPFPWMKPLWANHHLHHYKDEHQGFGVSSLLWDRLFGTAFDLSKNKEDKEKVKELMIQD